MSEHEEKSHIADEKLVALTDAKLQELQAERKTLDERLRRLDNGGAAAEQRALLESQIANHDAAYDKLVTYREEMADGVDARNE